MAGGTALALQVGHRKSIDFDLFSEKEFDNLKIRNSIKRAGYSIEKVLMDEQDQFTVIVEKVKITFLHYPFKISTDFIDKKLKAPDILTLSSMKAYTISRRAKWKDYVDLFCILNSFHSLTEIVKKAENIFGNEFNEKIFRESLVYFDDIDYSEEVIFASKYKTSDKKIKESLLKLAMG